MWTVLSSLIVVYIIWMIFFVFFKKNPINNRSTGRYGELIQPVDKDGKPFRYPPLYPDSPLDKNSLSSRRQNDRRTL
jgi:cell division protein FtsN